MKSEVIHFWVNAQNAPYVQTKPFHKSQKLIEERDDGSKVFEIQVVINQELQREFFGFADSIRILSPQSLVNFMNNKLKFAVKRYESDTELSSSEDL